MGSTSSTKLRWALRGASLLCLLMSWAGYVLFTFVTQLRVPICDNFHLDNPDPRCTAWPPWLALMVVAALGAVSTLVASFWPTRKS